MFNGGERGIHGGASRLRALPHQLNNLANVLHRPVEIAASSGQCSDLFGSSILDLNEVTQKYLLSSERLAPSVQIDEFIRISFSKSVSVIFGFPIVDSHVSIFFVDVLNQLGLYV
jgi:hypothetical protein